MPHNADKNFSSDSVLIIRLILTAAFVRAAQPVQQHGHADAEQKGEQPHQNAAERPVFRDQTGRARRMARAAARDIFHQHGHERADAGDEQQTGRHADCVHHGIADDLADATPADQS